MKRIHSFAIATGALVAGSAQAALNTEASTALTNISTAVTDMETGVWPVVALAVTALIGFKLFKRFIAKV